MSGGALAKSSLLLPLPLLLLLLLLLRRVLPRVVLVMRLSQALLVGNCPPLLLLPLLLLPLLPPPLLPLCVCAQGDSMRSSSDKHRPCVSSWLCSS
jgi:hypothetical protein